MFENKITFCACEYDMVDVWPRPQSASRVIPDEYKRLEKFKDGNMHNVTVKSCMPFLDALTLGYIIFFDQDYIVDPVENDLSIILGNSFQRIGNKRLENTWENFIIDG